MRTGRNETCPCGSGRKFKSCCEGKSARGVSKGLFVLFGVIAAIALVGLIPLFTGKGDARAPTASASTAAPRTSAPQPPGPVPAGKVWSVEHGHWHDAVPNPTATPAPAPPLTPGPQPPGPVPAGKVWSTEHGHWHDAATP
jgi:hypothetical protein